MRFSFSCADRFFVCLCSLYPKIHQSQPDLAGKITGMLLEMDSSELLYLLENDEALAAKVRLSFLSRRGCCLGAARLTSLRSNYRSEKLSMFSRNSPSELKSKRNRRCLCECYVRYSG